MAGNLNSVAATLRGGGRVKLLSPLNEKSPKGEGLGYLTAILYLAPHTLAGGRSVCPHSTAACRDVCLYSAGRGTTPRVQNARLRRTRLYLDDRQRFLDELVGDLVLMQETADAHGLKLAIRLNGTSDILWEREPLDGKTLFELFPRAVFYDYTRTPFRHRKVPDGWRLTYSLADDPVEEALPYLFAGHGVAAVIPEWEKERAPAFILLGERSVPVVDGDEHDLRFLDPPGSLVLLRPKGRATRGGPMVRPALLLKLIKAANGLR